MQYEVVDSMVLDILRLQVHESDEDSWRRRASAFDEVKAESGSFYAFHGTWAENLHSILRCGKLATVFSHT